MFQAGNLMSLICRAPSSLPIEWDARMYTDDTWLPFKPVFGKGQNNSLNTNHQRNKTLHSGHRGEGHHFNEKEFHSSL